jgi:septum formation protein
LAARRLAGAPVGASSQHDVVTGGPVTEIVLASVSPRRQQLLAAAGVSFTVVPAHVDETVVAGEPPDVAVVRLARAKARAVAAARPDQVVLGADTLVAVDGTGLGKPADLAEARQMLRRLSGRAHVVYTGVALVRHRPPLDDAWVAATEVVFRPLTDVAIEAYMARVNTLDKAGAYAIQEHGEMLVDRISGLFSTVVGLPVEEVVLRLRAALPG